MGWTTWNGLYIYDRESFVDPELSGMMYSTMKSYASFKLKGHSYKCHGLLVPFLASLALILQDSIATCAG